MLVVEGFVVFGFVCRPKIRDRDFPPAVCALATRPKPHGIRTSH